jgi:hypothetical protein
MAQRRSLVFLSIPGLRFSDLPQMPKLSGLGQAGRVHELQLEFPAVTWPVEATLLTGVRPKEHGIVANGVYDRTTRQVEMWTFGNEMIARPQIWDRLRAADRNLTSAAWFPMLSKRCGADYVCMPAPVHHPDGSESLWCYTQPSDLYGRLLERLGHFPLQHFWGPLANIKSSEWIARSAALVAEWFRPDFFFIYLPHLDYAAQKFGPDSPPARQAVHNLDALIGSLADDCRSAYPNEPVWLAASEYAIIETNQASFPNRLLREFGLLRVADSDTGESLDWQNSEAWALVDHQLSHVFVRDSDPRVVRQVAELFRGQAEYREVLIGSERARRHIDHPRCGDVVLISQPDYWQAYYWWLDDRRAPPFARTVDIHRKPGYDPVELHFDPATRSIPLDAGLVRGSHGVPSDWTGARPVIITSRPMFNAEQVADVDVCPAVLEHFGCGQIPAEAGR